MAVLHREASRLHLPADFGLGLAVTTVIGGVLLLLVAAVEAVPTQGPRGEAHQPDPAITYDIPAPVPSTFSNLALH